jgi:cellulose synthase/poly-beta-1,6-N-acetylglucosamine synthase-like glycosyltransferase
MENLPFVSIIIPVKNEELLIANCLKSLRELNYPKDRYEIIISDGLSTDNTVKIAQNYGAKIVSNIGQTVAPGRNIGFEASRGEIIAFSDADCVMDKNWLANAIKYFNDESVAGAGGPNLAPANESAFGKAVRFLFLFGSMMSGSVYVSDSQVIKRAISLPGCNAIYKRKALEKVMPTDETLLTCDDVEMNYQLIKQGYKLLYTHDVIVWHYRRDNPKKFWRQIYRYSIGRLQLGKMRKDGINLIHITFGSSIPLFILLIIFSYVLNPIYPLFIIGAALIILTIFAGLNFYQEKSLKVALNAFLAMAIFILAWSAGFIRELLFPIKKVAGK